MKGHTPISDCRKVERDFSYLAKYDYINIFPSKDIVDIILFSFKTTNSYLNPNKS